MVESVGKYGRGTYEPDPRDAYPFQKDITTQNAELTITRLYSDSHWGFGVSAMMLPRIVRADLESIKSETQTAFGPHVQGLWRSSGLEYRLTMTALAGSEGYGGAMSHRILKNVFCPYFVMGLELEAAFLKKGESSLRGIDGYLLFGFEF